MKKVNTLVISALVCFAVLSSYYWNKRYEKLNAQIVAAVESSQKETETIQQGLSDLCERFSKIEGHLKKTSSPDVPFKIVEDKG
jgi:hypothetical protein